MPSSGPGPSDRTLDRRGFVRRMAAATAAAAGGGLAAPPAAGEHRAAPTPDAGALPAPRRPQPDDPVKLTVAEAAGAIRDGRLSAAELTEAYLERIRRWDGVYLASTRLRRTRPGPGRKPWTGPTGGGPLHGIPLALKDNFRTAGVLTSANSYIFQDFTPEEDATAWRRLREGGAVLLGKTQMGPLATSRATTPDGEHTTVSAWAPDDPEVSPGGSSSGSATAVAARLASAATGTQTGGSITGPAGAQGLTGLKPTMGRVSLRGIVPLTYSRDHPGPLARDALDAALLLEAMAGQDPEDPRTLGLPPAPDYWTAAVPVRRRGRPTLRWPTTIGVLPGTLEAEEPDEDEEVEAEEREESEPAERERRARRRERRRRHERAAAAARRRILSTFEELGARVVEVDPPADWDVLTSWHFNNVRLPERSEPFLDVLRDDVRKFGVSLSPWINGLLMPAAEFQRGQRARVVLLRRVMDDVFAECDVVVQTRTFPFDMIGLPLAAFPVGFEEESIGTPRPVGGMLGGLPYAEDRLLSLVAGYQSVTDFHLRRPPDPAGEAGAERISLERARPGDRRRPRRGIPPIAGRVGDGPTRRR